MEPDHESVYSPGRGEDDGSDSVTYDTTSEFDRNNWIEQVEMEWELLQDDLMIMSDYRREVDPSKLDEGLVVGHYGHVGPRFDGRYRSEIWQSASFRHEVGDFRWLVYVYLVETFHLVTPRPWHLPWSSEEYALTPEHIMPIDQMLITPDGKDECVPLKEFCVQYRGEMCKRILEGRLSDEEVPTMDHPYHSLQFCMRDRFNGCDLDYLMNVNCSLDGMLLEDDDTMFGFQKIPLMMKLRRLYQSGPMAKEDRIFFSYSDGYPVSKQMKTMFPTVTDLFCQRSLCSMAQQGYHYLQRDVQAKFIEYFPDPRILVLDMVLAWQSRKYVTAFYLAGWISLRSLLLWGKLDDALDLLMRVEEIWAYRDCPLRNVDGPWYRQYSNNAERIAAFKFFVVRLYNYSSLRLSLAAQPPGGVILDPSELEAVADLLFSDKPRSERMDILYDDDRRPTELGSKIQEIRHNGGLRQVFPHINTTGSSGIRNLYIPMQQENGTQNWSPFLPGMIGHALNTHGPVRLMTFMLDGRGGGNWNSIVYSRHDDEEDSSDMNPGYWDTHDDFEVNRMKPALHAWAHRERAVPSIPIANNRYFGLVQGYVPIGIHDDRGQRIRNRSSVYPFNIDLESILDY